MANQIIILLAETYGLRIYAIMLPPSDFSVAHFRIVFRLIMFVYRI